MLLAGTKRMLCMSVLFSPPQEEILAAVAVSHSALIVIKKLFSLRSNLRKIKSVSVCTLHTAQRQTEHSSQWVLHIYSWQPTTKNNKKYRRHKSYFWCCPLAPAMCTVDVWTFHSLLTRCNMCFWFHIWMYCDFVWQPTAMRWQRCFTKLDVARRSRRVAETTMWAEWCHPK